MNVRIKTQLLNLALSRRMKTENKMQFTACCELYAVVSSHLIRLRILLLGTMSVTIHSLLLAAFTDRLSYFTNPEVISRDHVWQIDNMQWVHSTFLTACKWTKTWAHLQQKMNWWTQQVAQLSQRDRAAGWVSNGQKWKTGTERQYLRTI